MIPYPIVLTKQKALGEIFDLTAKVFTGRFLKTSCEPRWCPSIATFNNCVFIWNHSRECSPCKYSPKKPRINLSPALQTHNWRKMQPMTTSWYLVTQVFPLSENCYSSLRLPCNPPNREIFCLGQWCIKRPWWLEGSLPTASDHTNCLDDQCDVWSFTIHIATSFMNTHHRSKSTT